MLALAPAANGAVLYANISGPGSPGGLLVDQTTQRVAQPFVPTSTGTPHAAGFYATTFGANLTGTASLSIYANNPANGGQPGEKIAAGTPTTFDDTSDAVPTCSGLNAVFGELPVLTAGQTYWAVFQTHTATPVFWGGSQLGGGAPRMSTDSGTTWGAPSGGALSLVVDDAATCGAADINSNPNPGVELGDMYAKPGGSAFQTLLVSNSGIAQLNLTGGSFTGTNASMFKVLDGEPDGHPPGSPFAFPKNGVGHPPGGTFLYIACKPPGGTPDGQKTATFTLTSNDPDEGSLSWPVWCLVDSTPPSIEFAPPDGRNGWFVTRVVQVRGVDPESGNRVKHIFCTDNGAATLDWPNGSVAPFQIQPDGIHALSCQGTDLANNTSAPGAYTTTVKVDGAPPETAQGDGGPPAVSGETAFSFSFTGSDATSGLGEFECRLDDGPYEVCASPAAVTGVRDGTHTFSVRARDVAGNYDPTPVQWAWEVSLCVVPAIDKGSSQSAVSNQLQTAGCALGKVTKKFNKKVKKKKLIKLNTAAGTELAAGAAVDASFSKGKKKK